MTDLVRLMRLSMSIEKPLYERMEALVQQRGYENRSEFIRDLIREQLVAATWEKGQEAVGTITLVYDHHKRQLSEQLTRLQHRHHHLVLAATHVHLDHDLCVESILVKGPADDVRTMADLLRKQKGVLHAALSMSSTGHDLD